MLVIILCILSNLACQETTAKQEGGTPQPVEEKDTSEQDRNDNDGTSESEPRDNSKAQGKTNTVRGGDDEASNSKAGSLPKDPMKLGPHEVKTKDIGKGIVYYPAGIENSDTKHPVIAWANGTMFTSAVYSEIIGHWVSHGLVVIGSKSTMAAAANDQIPMLKAMKQSQGQDHPWSGKLAVNKLGISGHSQGGSATMGAASDPMVTTTIIIQSGGVGGGRSPILFLSGSADNIIAAPLVKTSYSGSSNNVKFLGHLNHKDSTHWWELSKDPDKYNLYHGISTAWWRWHLMGDRRMKAMFQKGGRYRKGNWSNSESTGVD